jgi:hypothetical protein
MLLQTLHSLRQKSRSVLMFAGALKYRMLPDIYLYLARLRSLSQPDANSRQ